MSLSLLCEAKNVHVHFMRGRITLNKLVFLALITSADLQTSRVRASAQVCAHVKTKSQNQQYLVV